MPASSPEWMEYVRAVVALVFVAGLIFFLGLVLKRTGLNQRLIGNKATPRMRVEETLYIDSRHRLVLVRHDSDEHLLLLGSTGDLHIHSRKAGGDEV